MTDEETIRIKIKQTATTDIHEIKIKKSQTILDLKKECEKKVNIPPEGQNLVYKGKILKDIDTVSTYNINNDHTIILVKKAAYIANKPISESSSTQQEQPQLQGQHKPQTTTQTPPQTIPQNQQETSSSANTQGNQFQQQPPNPFMMPGMGTFGLNPVLMNQALNQMMNNPQMFNQICALFNDPNTFNMIMNSPQVKALLDSNPQMREAFQDPQIRSQFLNPQTFQYIAQMMGREFPGMGMPAPQSMPQSMNMDWMNMYGMPQFPGTSSQPQSSSGMHSQQQGMNMDWMNLFGMPQQNQGTVNTGINNQQETNVNYKEKYKTELAQLKDMGFINEEANIQVLKQCSGNVQFAIEKLLNMLQ